MAGVFKAAWDRVRNVGTFSVDGMTSAVPMPAPRFLPGTGVSTAGPDAVEYYVRFVSQAGTVVTLGGDQLFALADFSYGGDIPLAIAAGTIGAGTLALGPLTLSMNEAVLGPTLLAELISVLPFTEVDVLGYATSGGALVSDASFGEVLGTSLTTSDAGGITFTASYGSVELQHSSPGTGGVLTPDPGFDWDSKINAAGFNDSGGVPVGPLAAPASLPASGVAVADSGERDTFVRFTYSLNGGGQGLTVEGASTFELIGWTYDLAAGANGKVATGPLTLSFEGAAANQLLPLLAAGTEFTTIDLTTYASTGETPEIVDFVRFGLGVATNITVGIGGSLQVTFSYGTIALYHYNAAGTVDSSEGWNAVNNTSTSNPPLPSNGPLTQSSLALTQGGIQSTGGGAAPDLVVTDAVNGLDYYVRLYSSSGAAIAVGGDTLFEISGYDFDANHPALGVEGKATFGPLTLTLDDPALNTTLAALTDGGTALGEIDVLSFVPSGPQAGHIVTDDSFGYVVGTQLSLGAGGAVSYTADYAAVALQSEWDDRDTWTADTPGTWDVLSNNAAFQTTAGGGGAPKTEPQTLSTIGVSTQGADAASYYVRFVNSAGTVLTIGGAQLFGVLGAGFANELTVLAAGGSLEPGKAELQPLSLTLADGALDPALFATLAAGTTLGELDVLGYNTATGALLSDDSFGAVQGRTISIGSGGTLQFTASYAAEELRQDSVNSSGSLVADTPATWNQATNTTGFSTSGTTATTPLAAPATLPGTGVAAGTQALTYYVRFISAAGATLSLDGNQLFALGTYSAEGQKLPAGGSTELGPLTLSFTDPALTPTLFGDLTGGTAFGEVDVIGYAASGTLMSEASFGNVEGAGLTVDGGGATQYGAAYGSVEFQTFNGAAPVNPGSWNAATKSAEFATNGSTPATPAAAPATLPASGVAAAGTAATGEYVRFIETGGTTLTVGGAQLFALTGFSTNATNHTPYSTTTPAFAPLTLQLGEAALDPSLFSLLATGHSFAEIDVLSYQVSDGLLVGDDSFGLAGAGSLSIDNTGLASYVVEYGAEEAQYGATGLQPDPGPTAATGTLTIAPLQSENVTALVDALITPGLAGDTETITAVTGHANLAAGVVTYTAPDAGTDTFTYTVEDELDNVATGTVDVTIAPVCFCAGTRIATPAGETPVEALRPGDLVTLADGRAAPVLWVGRQTVSRRFADPARVLPVRVRAGALGDNLPKRDLLLSPGHALLLDGLLIQAGALVDGTAIVQAEGVPDVFTYWHVELAEHALLLAEGVDAESFLDAAEPTRFDNEADRPARAAPAGQLPHPRVKARRQLPQPLRRRLAARAAA
jgi:hypothetical protein